jgi:hypothetical protein
MTAPFAFNDAKRRRTLFGDFLRITANSFAVTPTPTKTFSMIASSISEKCGSVTRTRVVVAVAHVGGNTTEVASVDADAF